MKRLLPFAVVVMLAGAVFPCEAMPKLQESGTTEPRPALVVRISHGSISVHGDAALKQLTWSTQPHAHKFIPDLHRKKISPGDQRVSVRVGGGEVRIESDANVDLFINVPESVAVVDLNTNRGDLSLNNVTARARLVSGGGHVTADHVSGTVEARTGGGDLLLRKTGPVLYAETGGGNIQVDAAQGDVRAETGGGNITITSANGGVRAETGGGNVVVQQAEGVVSVATSGGNVEMGNMGSEVRAETGSGNIRVASARGFVHAQTGSGSIECRQLGSGLAAGTGSGRVIAQFAGSGHLQPSVIESVSGDIAITMPPSASAHVQVKTGNPWGHSIHSDFSQINVQQNDGGLEAAGDLNGGGAVLRVSAENGNVVLLRGK